MFVAGTVCEGSWFDHTAGWWKAYKGPKGAQIFWLPFEELKVCCRPNPINVLDP